MLKSASCVFKKHLFQEVPIIGILRNIAYKDVQSIIPLYKKAGLTTLEITMNSADALQIIKYAVKKHGHHLNIGAGTVCNTDDLERGLSAGAQFIVSPIIDEDVIKECRARNIPVFPGAYTPTEIFRAWSLGAEMVKVFPSGNLGPAYFKDVLAPLNHVKLLATGGVNLINLPVYLQAGVAGFGIGSTLFKTALIEGGQWEELEAHFCQFVKIIKTSLKTADGKF